MINDQSTMERDMEAHKSIDIQERTFKFGVRIIRFVDKLPRTLSATEIGRQLLRSGTSIAANMKEANDELVRILFAILRKARSARAVPQH
jgi:four helix bundle protein